MLNISGSKIFYKEVEIFYLDYFQEGNVAVAVVDVDIVVAYRCLDLKVL